MRKKPLPKPKLLPYFEPLPIYNENIYSISKLPPHVDSGDLYNIFKLFWTDELLNMLIEYINRNIELYLTSEEKILKGSP
jgi:hypothetical protein